MAAVKKAARTFTYADYCTWSNEERWELMEGVAYNMSPAPSRRHQDISRELLLQIGNFLKGRPCRVYDAPFDVRLPLAVEEDDAIETVVQPDLVVICDRDKLDEKGCRGAPDIVIEIVSSATAVRDKKEKFVLYEKHGVKEYWLVEPADNTVMVFILGDDDQYGKPAFYSVEDTIHSNVIKGLSVELKTVFASDE